VPLIERCGEGVVATLDPHEMRRRGFQALRDLLHRLAERKRLVIAIDDIQWGDEDSMNALVEVLAPPHPPSLLLVMCARSDDSGPVVAQARKAMSQSGITLTDVELGPLSGDEVDELTRRLIQQRGGIASGSDLITAVHRECGGHPLLLNELVLAGGPDASEQHPTLRHLLARRLEALPTIARRLLEFAAIAGRPRPLAILMRAVGEGENIASAMHLLAGERLIRMRGVGGHDEVAIYHDKIAETSLQLINDEQTRNYHLSLAEAIAALCDPAQEADALATHYLAGGDRLKAVNYGIIAADHAANTLAFDRASELYRIVLGLLPANSERPDLQLKLADALAYAGHGPDAARAYLCAAGTTEPVTRLHALDRAAGQYLRSGYMDDGLRAARAVLSEVGVPWNTNSLSALISLLFRRLRIRWRGIALKERQVDDIPADGLARMDVLWSLGHGLGGVDTVRGAEFHSRHLLMALNFGDPYRISRGLAWEAILTAAEGGAGGRLRARELIDKGHALARRLHNEHAAAWNWAAEAYSYWCEGRWTDAVSCCEEAARRYREKCLDITWELGSVYAWCWMPVLCYSGQFAKLRMLVTQVEREFGQLGDLYTLVTMATVVKPWLTLLDGDPERARSESAQAVAQWSRQHWHLQHLFDLMTRARTLLYDGDGLGALQALERDWPRYRSSMQNRLQLKRMFMHGLRAQAVVMACVQGTIPATRIREAASYARKLEDEGTRWASAYAASVRAAILVLDMHREQAQTAYRAVADEFHEAGMVVHAAAARRRAAELMKGEFAAEALRAADHELRQLGAADPARFAAACVAGMPP
jgi:tetratricopeptide (TPR) repeat protein